MNSAMNVALGTRKLPEASSMWCAIGELSIRRYLLDRTKTNSTAKARLMKYAASTRPTVRKNSVCSCP